ncbi:MAG: TonB C-terminal domain-containing protein [Rubrivivax sp.]|nr:TonB C-terminal domain-containing protein [Rubrivivax sp.]
MVTVAVRSDGSVESVTVVVPSGVPELDEAIRRIVMALAPYPPFFTSAGARLRRGRDPQDLALRRGGAAVLTGTACPAAGRAGRCAADGHRLELALEIRIPCRVVQSWQGEHGWQEVRERVTRWSTSSRQCAWSMAGRAWRRRRRFSASRTRH